MNLRFSTRRAAATALLGLGLFQASLIGAGAMQVPGTPETDQQAPVAGEAGTIACEVIEGALPGDVNVTVTVTDADGETSTVNVSVDQGAGGVIESRLIEDGVEVDPGDAEVTEATPGAGTQPGSDDTADDPTTQQAPDNMDEESASIVSQGTGASEAFCAVSAVDAITDVDDADTGTDPADAGDDEANAGGTNAEDEAGDAEFAISAEEAIAIARSVADGEFQSLVLDNEGGNTVYVVTIGDQEVVIDAQTGEVYPAGQQP